MPSERRVPLVLGNWKMNTSLGEAKELASRSSDIATSFPAVEVGILPPAVWLLTLREQLSTMGSSLRLGAQDISQQPNGAFTGDLSASMLAPWCEMILVGHSERRQHHEESDEIVRAKLDAVLGTDRTPVLAIGETAAERDAGSAREVVQRQLDIALGERPATQLARVVIAYEPVWAIGTGTSASADDAQEMAAIIRDWVRRHNESAAATMRLLYGGSMKPENAGEILARPDVDGGLIGGASLAPDQFQAIVAAAASSTAH